MPQTFGIKHVRRHLGCAHSEEDTFQTTSSDTTRLWDQRDPSQGRMLDTKDRISPKAWHQDRCRVKREYRTRHRHLASHPHRYSSRQANHPGLLLPWGRGAYRNSCRIQFSHLRQRNQQAERLSHQDLRQEDQHPRLPYRPRTGNNSYLTHCLGEDPEQMRFRYSHNQRHLSRAIDKSWKRSSDNWMCY